jgi:hypothetical protein
LQEVERKNILPPSIKLCIGVQILAGGSYLDLSFGYDTPQNTVIKYSWQALNAINCSTDPFLDTINSPIHVNSDDLSALKNGFAAFKVSALSYY